MFFICFCISCFVFLFGVGVVVVVQVEVCIDGFIEYGVFESCYQDFQFGEWVLICGEQNIQQIIEVLVKFGIKFGMCY